jgi:hypothetical protein
MFVDGATDAFSRRPLSRAFRPFIRPNVKARLGSRVRIAGRRFAGTFATHPARPRRYSKLDLPKQRQGIVDFAPKVTDCFRSSCVGKREARSHRRRSPDRPPSGSHPRKAGRFGARPEPGASLAGLVERAGDDLLFDLRRRRLCLPSTITMGRPRSSRWRSRLTHPPAAAQSSCGRHRKSGRCRSAPRPPRAGPALRAADAG